MHGQVQRVCHRLREEESHDISVVGRSSTNGGDIASEWKHFGIAAREKLNSLGGGRGFNSFRRAAHLPHLVSCADFFLVPKFLIFFKRNQVFQTRSAEFLRRNKADRSDELSVSTIYFLSALPGRLHPKNVAKFPWGGEGSACT